MRQLKSSHLLSLILLMVVLWVFIGCASLGKYSLQQTPAEDTKSFISVEVAEITAGITQDELEPETAIELRSAIIEAIQKKKIYQQINTESGMEEGVLLIKCKITEYDSGSQFLRWLVGFGAGKAYLETSCQFINKKTDKVIASGIFSGEVKGGWFGGSANQTKMAEYIADAVARFLKKGK